MYRILIVDDEHLIRAGLKTSIPWEKYGFEIAGEAGNGLQALDVVQKLKPDLVITDIKMPEMDGIELIRRLSQLYPAVKCLVLSNYDEFSLVREAMRMGAVDYLLKVTLDEKVIMDVLGGIINSLEKEKLIIHEAQEFKIQLAENRRLVKRVWLKDIAKIRPSFQELIKKISDNNLRVNLENGSFLLVTIDEYSKMAEGKFERDYERMLQTLLNILDGAMNSMHFKGEGFEWRSGILIGMISKSKGTNPEDDKWLAEQVVFSMKSYLDMDVRVIYGIKYSDSTDLFNKLQGVDEFLDSGFYQLPGTVFNVVASPTGTFDSVKEIYSSVLAKLEAYIKFDNFVGIEKAIMGFLDGMKEKNISPLIVRQCLDKFTRVLDEKLGQILKTDGIMIEGKLERVNLWEVCHIDTLKAEYRLYLSWLEQLRRNHGDLKKFRNEITRVLEYMQIHYNQGITLDKLSRIAGMNRTYFCKIFRDEVGMSFQPYLQSLRMEKAKELLLGDNMNTAEIAGAVGFKDVFYFYRSFKHYFNISIGEFRRKESLHMKDNI